MRWDFPCPGCRRKHAPPKRHLRWEWLNTENTILLDTSVLRPDLIVSDVIYNPRETRFLREAKEAGCPVFNGMYMLLYQGAAAFRLWTGQDMPVNAIKKKFFFLKTPVVLQKYRRSFIYVFILFLQKPLLCGSLCS